MLRNREKGFLFRCMKLTIAIIGASTQRHKFGNKAVRAYTLAGWEVYPVHPRALVIKGHRAYPSLRELPVERLDRVSIYLPPSVGLQVIDDVAAKPCGEVWLNPGAESPQLIERARQLGLPIKLGCSIIAVGIEPQDLDD
jgi:hypothetical protein